MEISDTSLTLLLGPLGLTVGLLFLFWLMLTERLIPKGRLEDQKAATREALDIAREANSALDRMADAVEQRNKLEAEQARIEAERLKITNERRRSS